MAKAVLKFDRRLIGTWKSDRRRTFQNLKPPSNASPQRLKGRKRFKAFFGKLVIRWGRGTMYTELNGYRDSVKYQIIARDSKSIVVQFRSALFDEMEFQQIHFDGDDHYWVGIGGGLMECFTRVK